MYKDQAFDQQCIEWSYERKKDLFKKNILVKKSGYPLKYNREKTNDGRNRKTNIMRWVMGQDPQKSDPKHNHQGVFLGSPFNNILFSYSAFEKIK